MLLAAEMVNGGLIALSYDGLWGRCRFTTLVSYPLLALHTPVSAPGTVLVTPATCFRRFAWDGEAEKAVVKELLRGAASHPDPDASTPTLSNMAAAGLLHPPSRYSSAPVIIYAALSLSAFTATFDLLELV